MENNLLLIENYSEFISTAKPKTIYKINTPQGDFCLIKNNDTVVILKDSCPHLGVPFSQSGVLNVFGDLVCKEHGHCYSIKTGQGCEHKKEFIKIYETELIERDLYLKNIF